MEVDTEPPALAALIVADSPYNLKAYSLLFIIILL